MQFRNQHKAEQAKTAALVTMDEKPQARVFDPKIYIPIDKSKIWYGVYPRGLL